MASSSCSLSSCATLMPYLVSLLSSALADADMPCAFSLLQMALARAMPEIEVPVVVITLPPLLPHVVSLLYLVLPAPIAILAPAFLSPNTLTASSYMAPSSSVMSLFAASPPTDLDVARHPRRPIWMLHLKDDIVRDIVDVLVRVCTNMHGHHCCCCPLIGHGLFRNAPPELAQACCIHDVCLRTAMACSGDADRSFVTVNLLRWKNHCHRPSLQALVTSLPALCWCLWQLRWHHCPCRADIIVSSHLRCSPYHNGVVTYCYVGVIALILTALALSSSMALLLTTGSSRVANHVKASFSEPHLMGITAIVAMVSLPTLHGCHCQCCAGVVSIVPFETWSLLSGPRAHPALPERVHGSFHCGCHLCSVPGLFSDRGRSIGTIGGARGM